MEIEVKRVTEWSRVLDAARMTVHKDALGKEPTEAFKRHMLMAEHSPIRLLEFDVVVRDIPQYVSVHLVRHFMGIEKFVATSREDRTGVPRNKRKQTDPVDCQFSLNAQALINISRRRLCGMADKETRKVWGGIIAAVRTIDPIVASYCVPNCVYRGRCPEAEGCGYDKKKAFVKRLKEYWA